MEEQELKNIWKGSSQNEEIKINNAKLMNDFKVEMQNREVIFRRRDQNEIMVAIMGIVMFSYITWRLPFSIRSVAAIFVALSLGYIIYKLRSRRKNKCSQDLFLPLIEQLKKQRKFMINQVKLLESVLYWYVLPFFISYAVFIWDPENMEAYDKGIIGFLLITKLKVKIIVTILMIILGVYIVRTNKRAAKVNWEPLIKNIDSILDSLKKE